PERIALSLDYEHGLRDRFELAQAVLARLVRTPRRVERERQAEHRDGTGLIDGPACDTRAERSAADNERRIGELLGFQMGHDRDPSGVELLRRSGRAPTGDAVGRLD